MPEEFRPIVVGFNGTMAAVSAPVEAAAQAMGSIAQGDIPARLDAPWQGDFARIRDGVNAVIDSVSGLRDGLGALAAGFGLINLAAAQTSPPAPATTDPPRAETVMPVIKASGSADRQGKDGVQATSEKIG